MAGAQVSAKRRSSREDTSALVFLVIAGAVTAGFAPGEPTGIVVWDAILKAAVAALVITAAIKAPRWAVIVTAAVAAAGGGFTLWGLAGWAALLVALVSVRFGRRNRILGALAGALAVQALLRFPAFGFFGLPSIVVAVACLVTLIAGYSYATSGQRRIVRRATAVSLLIVLVVMLVAASSLLGARSDVDSGVSAARRGLSAARSGDTANIVDELFRAETSLESANASVSSVPVRLMRLVPVLAQHQRALEAATSAGATAAREAAASVRDADIANMSLSAGAVDIAALQTMAPQLNATVQALNDAQTQIDAADSPWLLGLVRNRVGELTDEIDGVLPELELAAEAARVVPTMLGVERPQTYFVIFGTPAESRELGGFIGSWALVTFDGGRLQLGESGRIAELYDVARASTLEAGTVSDWFIESARPTQFPQNLTSSPEFTQVANAARQVLGGASATPVDGFVYLDAWAVIDLLQLTGPVDIPFQDQPLTAQNGADFFFDGQYRLEEASRDDIFDGLSLVASSVASQLAEQALPGPEELGRILGPAARAGRIQVATFDETQNDFLRSVKLLRDFDPTETADFVALVQSNALSNKLDLYLERSFEYDVQLAADGSLTATATATLLSNVPDDAPQSTLGRARNDSQSQLLLSLYSPHRLQAVIVNGTPTEFQAAGELGLVRYLTSVTLVPGQPVTVQFELEGDIVDPENYAVRVWEQPLVNNDDLQVHFAGPQGTFTWQGLLTETVDLVAESLAG